MKRVYSSKITIFFSFFGIVIFSAMLIFSTVELISGALQGKMNIVFVGLVAIIACIGFIFLSAIALNRCGYKVIYDRENNIIYREGFICGYKRQVNVDNIKEYISSKYESFDIITDVGSGINYNKPGLLKLIEKINKKEVDLIVVLYKDRLLRFGFELVEHFAKLNNVSIEVLESKMDKTQDQELVEDLVQIITVFSSKIQGKRKSKTREIMNEFAQKIQEIND